MNERIARLEQEVAALRQHDADLGVIFEKYEAEAAALRAERDALGEQLEYDRSLVADCVTAAKKAVRGRDWLTDGRGCYEWDDDKWHTEFAAAATEFVEAIEPMVKVAANWKGCPQDAASVAKARIDSETQLARYRAPVSEMRRTIWYEDWKPIINAIGEISVQEAMDAIERSL